MTHICLNRSPSVYQNIRQWMKKFFPIENFASIKERQSPSTNEKTSRCSQNSLKNYRPSAATPSAEYISFPLLATPDDKMWYNISPT